MGNKSAFKVNANDTGLSVSPAATGPSENSGERSPHSVNFPQVAGQRNNPGNSAPTTIADRSSMGGDSGVKADSQKRQRDGDDTLSHTPRDYPRHPSLRLPYPAPSQSAIVLARSDSHALKPGDIEPYLILENKYPRIFSTNEISRVAVPTENQFGILKDVGMDRVLVINASTDVPNSIGTTGVATCIAACARSKNDKGEILLGLCHSSGIVDAIDVLKALHSEMEKRGAIDVKVYLVGGMINTEDEGGGTLEIEEEMLSLNREFQIAGAKLHLSKGEIDLKTGKLNGVNVVLTSDHVSFSEKEIFTPAENSCEGQGDCLMQILNDMCDATDSEATDEDSLSGLT